MKKLFIISFIILLVFTLYLPVFAETIQTDEVSITDWLEDHDFTVKYSSDKKIIFGERVGYEIRFMNGSLYINGREEMDAAIEFKDEEFYGGVDELNELYNGQLIITGNWKFKDEISKVLEKLKDYPEEYEVVKNIKNISCGMHPLAFFNFNVITLSMNDLYNEKRLMSTILHEATHIKDMNNGITDIDQLEANAYKAQRAFWIELGADDYEIAYLDKEFNRQYWKTFWQEW